jgi:hypothetical protein
MLSGFLEWILSVFVSSGAIAGILYVFREAIGTFFGKSIEHRFEKKLELFRSEIRDSEAELDQIRSYLTSAKRDREGAFLQKKLEAAETLLRARFALSQLSIMVEFMKSLNVENILKSLDPKIPVVIQEMLRPFDVDEKLKQYGQIDKTLPRLYLCQETLDAFNVYEEIVFQAVMMMKVFAVDLRDKQDLLKKGDLPKKIQELVPTSKDGFEKFGDGYAYYWANYFHDRILKALRHEISGIDDAERDAKSVERLAIDSKRVQMKARVSLAESGLPDQLINPVEQVEAPGDC